MSKVVYVGPTIPGIAVRNTVYAEMPSALQTVAAAAPYMAGLCIPIGEMRNALAQIRSRKGSIYTLYKKALEDSAKLKGMI